MNRLFGRAIPVIAGVVALSLVGDLCRAGGWEAEAPPPQAPDGDPGRGGGAVNPLPPRSPSWGRQDTGGWKADAPPPQAPDGDPDGEVYRILLDNARRIRDIIRKIQNLRDVVETEYTRGRLMVDVDASSGDE